MDNASIPSSLVVKTLYWTCHNYVINKNKYKFNERFKTHSWPKIKIHLYFLCNNISIIILLFICHPKFRNILISTLFTNLLVASLKINYNFMKGMNSIKHEISIVNGK